VIKNNIENRVPVAQPPSGYHNVRDQERGFVEDRLVSTYSSFAAQASPVDVHNPHNGHTRYDHRLVGSGVVVGHNRSETPRRFRRVFKQFVHLHRVAEGEFRSGFGKFVCEMMEGDSFQSSDCEDGVTDGNKAVAGVVGQTGIREHADRGHVGKLDKTIWRSSL
jgi:hypothetical protein